MFSINSPLTPDQPPFKGGLYVNPPTCVAGNGVWEDFVTVPPYRKLSSVSIPLPIIPPWARQIYFVREWLDFMSQDRPVWQMPPDPPRCPQMSPRCLQIPSIISPLGLPELTQSLPEPPRARQSFPYPLPEPPQSLPDALTFKSLQCGGCSIWAISVQL